MTNPLSSERVAPVAVRKGRSPIRALQDEVNSLFHDFFGETLPHWWQTSEHALSFGVSPATDVAETDKEFNVTLELPGIDAKDVVVSISDGYVTVKGEKKEETKEEKNGYFRQERSYGEFQRIIAFPPNLADVEKAEAAMEYGVLTITVPKKADAEAKIRKLDIKNAA